MDTTHSIISTGVPVVLVMRSYVSSTFLCAYYLIKLRGEIDSHLLDIKYYIFCQEVHLVLVTSFNYFFKKRYLFIYFKIVSILIFIYTFLRGVVSETDWVIWLTKIGLLHWTFLLIELTYLTVFTLINIVKGSEWFSTLAH